MGPNTPLRTEVTVIVYHLCVHKCIVIGQELIPWSGVLPQKLTGSQLVKPPQLVTPAFSLPHSQVPATFLYPEPNSSNLPVPIAPLVDLICCYLPVYARIFQMGSFCQASQPKRVHISPVSHMQLPFHSWFDDANIWWGVQIKNLPPRSALKFFLL